MCTLETCLRAPAVTILQAVEQATSTSDHREEAGQKLLSIFQDGLREGDVSVAAVLAMREHRGVAEGVGFAGTVHS